MPGTILWHWGWLTLNSRYLLIELYYPPDPNGCICRTWSRTYTSPCELLFSFPHLLFGPWQPDAEHQAIMLRGALCAMGEPVLQWKAKMKERQRIPLASFIEGLGGSYLLSSWSSEVWELTSHCFYESWKPLRVLDVTKAIFSVKLVQDRNDGQSHRFMDSPPCPTLMASCTCRPQDSPQNLGLLYFRKIDNVRDLSFTVRKRHFMPGWIYVTCAFSHRIVLSPLASLESSFQNEEKSLQGVLSVRKKYVPLIVPDLKLLNPNRSHSCRYSAINLNVSTVIHIIWIYDFLEFCFLIDINDYYFFPLIVF